MIINKILNFLKIFFSRGAWLVIVRNGLKLNNPIRTNQRHLKEAINWLDRAQENGKGGVSAGFNLRTGWLPPYPETTGYIISTFIDYYKLTGQKDYLHKAIRLGEWEMSIQLPSGALPGGIGINDYPIVFNTAQVILGWVHLYKITNDFKFLKPAIKAADWLVNVQDADGKWSKFTYNNTPHTYHSRVAWALLEVGNITKTKNYFVSAQKNIEWVLNQYVDNNLWINYMGFTKDEIPFTHTVAYTIRGLVEAAQYLETTSKEKVLNLVYKFSEKLLHFYERSKHNPYAVPKYLPARINNQWKSKSQYSCLTGNAQIAIIWLKVYQLNQDARFINAALKIIDQLKAIQSLDSLNLGIKGGLAGSYPIYGRYMKFIYPNWATKFLADAIMLQEEVLVKIE